MGNYDDEIILFLPPPLMAPLPHQRRGVGEFGFGGGGDERGVELAEKKDENGKNLTTA